MPTLTADNVRSLYREMLGREVESDEVLGNHLKGHPTPDSLRASILQSDEYLAKHPRPDLWRFLSTNMARRAPRIDAEVTAEQLEQIFQRIARQWTSIATTEPHWSVLTNDKFRTASFAENEEEFYRSGHHVASLVDTFATRNGVTIPKTHALEIGCGTGRVTAALAGQFETVTAVDISAGHLDLCRAALAQRSLSNVEFVHLADPHTVTTLPGCSFLLSTIVLQHNPPPLIAYLLDWLLSKVEPGGAALFQVPTHTPGYEFDVKKYLASPLPKDFEMHCLPMHYVFALLQRHGFVPVEVIMDTWTGLPGSHTFFATKP
jgi:SAM-dependent methyltransferase